tara:strand:- start:796 stop:1389 length:594 start_codon:yes stop_codon:yes gene_type:complete
MNKKLLNYIESSNLPTDFGIFKVYAFTETDSDKDHLAITIGDLDSKSPILARIHSQCITGESFFSMRCDCRFQLTESMNQMAKNKSGVIFYLQQEGRGIGLSNKIRAYKLQDGGMDTVEANHQLGFHEDERNYEIVVSMAEHLNIKSFDLMTNNPKKINALEKMGLKINKRVPILGKSNKYNKKYLETKAQKLGHLL